MDQPSVVSANDSHKAMPDLVRATAALTRESGLNALAAALVDQAVDITQSDLGALYLFADLDKGMGTPKLLYRRGRHDVPKSLRPNCESVALVSEFNDLLVLHDADRPYFADAFLDFRMRSAIVAPLAAGGIRLGVLFLNAEVPELYRHVRLRFIESFVPLAAGMLQNSRLLDEVRRKLREIEALERYQENVFSSMTDLLVTTDQNGVLRYFNRAAQERLKLAESHLGQPMERVFSSVVAPDVLKAIERSQRTGEALLGIEGIASASDREIDFSLNVSPLRGKRGRREGVTLLFTDQSAERELKSQMDVVKEERRIVKDMFARYLSQDVVENLMQQPGKVRLGGDKKLATVFFADIRGYTSFAEDKDPEHILEVLNAYFAEAVEHIIRRAGFIDKFIGDAIMAAWGVPLETEEQDAVNAVSCALEIQERVRSPNRSFFLGDASELQVGIGLHTGALVAGNIGSTERMDYSIIGDSVNVAARLESIARGGEVIITKETRDVVGDRARVEELEPVQVKGKTEPIPIFRVLEMVS